MPGWDIPLATLTENCMPLGAQQLLLPASSLKTDCERSTKRETLQLSPPVPPSTRENNTNHTWPQMEVAFPVRKHSYWDKSILQDLFLSDCWERKEPSSGSICFCFHHIQGSVGNVFTRRNETVPRMTHCTFSKAPSWLRAGTRPHWKRKGWWGLSYLGHSGLGLLLQLVLNSLFYLAMSKWGKQGY